MLFAATSLWNLETAPWYALAVYWVLSVLRLKPRKVKEGAGGRLLHSAVMTLVLLLLASHRLDLGFLGRRVVPENSLLRDFGIFLTFAGAGIAYWARYCLGQYWSGSGHAEDGPSAHPFWSLCVRRHPTDSGLLLAMAGTALVIGEWRAC